VDGKAETEGLEKLLGRHSIGPKHLGPPGPTPSQVRTAFAAALRAPDHGKLVPFRFVVIEGDGLSRLADLFIDYGRRCGKSDDELATERVRAMQAPMVIAVIARIDQACDIPPHEQWIAVGGAVTNVLNALHFMGFGAKMLSGLRASDPEITAAFCGKEEKLVGWISVGTPKSGPTPRSKDRLDDIYSSF
jgi:nitroreductase